MAAEDVRGCDLAEEQAAPEDTASLPVEASAGCVSLMPAVQKCRIRQRATFSANITIVGVAARQAASSDRAKMRIRLYLLRNFAGSHGGRRQNPLSRLHFHFRPGSRVWRAPVIQRAPDQAHITA